MFYKYQLSTLLLSLLVISTTYGQKTKIKTITIVDGDTTVNEETISEADFAWDEKSDKSKKVKVMKFISSDDSTSGASEMEMIIDDNDKKGKAVTKTVIVMDDGGKVITNDIEKNISYVIEIDDNGKKTKKVWTEAETVNGNDKKKVVKMCGPTEVENIPVFKNINLNVDTKTLKIKLDIESEKSDAINVVVMDELGKQVFYDSQKDGTKYKKEIKLEKKGVYFLSIIQNKKVMNERIVME